MRAIQLSASRVPQLLGAQSLPRIDVYFFRSRDEFRRALLELAKALPESLAPTVRGLSNPSGPRPGTYHDASMFANVGDTVRTVAHEFTHQVERGMAASQPIPQWFNEGVAEAIAFSVAGEAERDYDTRSRFVRSAKSVNAARANALPALLPLQTGSQWSTAMGSTGLVQEVAFLAVERQANSVGARLASLGRVLSLMGSGDTFDKAFSGVYGQTPAAFEQGFRNYVSGPLAQEFPPGLKAQHNTVAMGDQLQFVWLGLQPGEVISRDFRGPGTCSNTGRGAADANGFMNFSFTRSSPCPGEWTFTGIGDKGSSATFTFRLTTP